MTANSVDKHEIYGTCRLTDVLEEDLQGRIALELHGHTPDGHDVGDHRPSERVAALKRKSIWECSEEGFHSMSNLVNYL